MMDKKLIRLSEFRNWIGIFEAAHKQKGTHNFTFIDNASEILNDVYWRYVENYIRPIIANKKGSLGESRISRFKIISATELCIVDVQPINLKTKNKKDERKLNAEFAWFVGLTVLISFSEYTISDSSIEIVAKYKEKIPGIDTSEILTILEEHIQWLILVDPSVQIPIISNSQTWRFFYLCLLALEGKIKK